MAKNVLGKGLGALITSSPAVSGVARPPALAQPAPGDIVRRVPLAQIVPSPLQPRKEFVAAQLTELMESIREHGVIQPLIVRPVNGKLELIAGERRFRASRELGLTEVPVITREATDKEVNGIHKNETYELVGTEELPAHANILGNTWMFKIKTGGLYRARQCVRGD
jgi:ParB family chromosome partitioning protein